MAVFISGRTWRTRLGILRIVAWKFKVKMTVNIGFHILYHTYHTFTLCSGSIPLILPYSCLWIVVGLLSLPTLTLIIPTSTSFTCSFSFLSFPIFSMATNNWSTFILSTGSMDTFMSIMLANVCLLRFLYGSSVALWPNCNISLYFSFTIFSFKLTFLKAEFSLRIFLTGTLSKLKTCVDAILAAAFCSPCVCNSCSYLVRILRCSSSTCDLFLIKLSI